jgi:hypothetical protein
VFGSFTFANAYSGAHSVKNGEAQIFEQGGAEVRPRIASETRDSQAVSAVLRLLTFPTNDVPTKTILKSLQDENGVRPTTYKRE